MGQYPAPGPAGGALRSRRSVALRGPVQPAPWGDCGGAGDHAQPDSGFASRPHDGQTSEEVVQTADACPKSI